MSGVEGMYGQKIGPLSVTWGRDWHIINMRESVLAIRELIAVNHKLASAGLFQCGIKLAG
ncbi:hypothetical protein DO70_317 [Burkholderia pseudomallei]|nr:hypothetical protein DO70_317 [Burkholderia pseudomallei]